MKSSNEIIILLKQYLPIAREKYGFTSMGIFGSVIRNEQTDLSDIDIFYEGKAPTFLTLDKIQQELEELLECSVDLVRVRPGMNRILRNQIEKEGVYV